MMATRDTCSSSFQVKLRPCCARCGSPDTGLDAGDARGRGVVGALHVHPGPLDLRADRRSSTTRGDRARVVERELIDRPARSPRPACCGLPNDRDVLAELAQLPFVLPRRKPSPVADKTTTEIIPQRMPNIVRRLRSLLARRF
jgi:hypothetical protein